MVLLVHRRVYVRRAIVYVHCSVMEGGVLGKDACLGSISLPRSCMPSQASDTASLVAVVKVVCIRWVHMMLLITSVFYCDLRDFVICNHYI